MSVLEGGGFDAQVDRDFAAFNSSGDLRHLEAALLRARQLTETVEPERRCAALLLLAALLIARAQLGLDMALFDEVLGVLKTVQAETSKQDEEIRIAGLMLEMTVRMHRYEWTCQQSDLQRTIRLAEMAENRPCDAGISTAISNLYGVALLRRYERERDAADLEAAIAAHRRSRASASDPLELAAAENNLAAALYVRFVARPDPADAQEGLSLTELVKSRLASSESARLDLGGLRQRAVCLRAKFLATAWLLRFDPDAIEEAVGSLDDELDDLPEGHPALPSVVVTLADILGSVGEVWADRDLLAKSLDLYGVVLQWLPADTTGWLAAQIGYAVVLSSRANLTGELDHLELAIAAHATLERAMVPPALQPQCDHNLAILLALRFQKLGVDADLDRALALHRSAAQSPFRDGLDGDLILICYADSCLQSYARDGRSADLAKAMDLLQQAVARPDVTVRRIKAMVTLAELAVHGQQWQLAASLADRALHSVESVVEAMDLSRWEDWLLPAQGVAGLGAYAAARSGDVALAAALLERGCSVLAGARISRQSLTLRRAKTMGFESEADAYEAAAETVRGLLGRLNGQADLITSTTAAVIAHQDSSAGTLTAAIAELSASRRMLEQRAGNILPAAGIAELVDFAAETEQEISYLVSTFVGGLRVRIVPANPGIGQDAPALHVEWLPELNNDAVEEWCLRIHDPSYEPVPGDGAAAAPFQPDPALVRGTQSHLPRSYHTRVTGVVAELARCLHQPLEHADPGPTAPQQTLRLIPVGLLGLLPIAAVFSGQRGALRPVSVAGSGLLHRNAHRRAGVRTPLERPQIAALTSPEPCQWEGRRWPALPFAAEEGAFLQRWFRARHCTGPDATAGALIGMFEDSSVDVIHLATHGHGSLDAGPYVRILLAETSDGQATSVTQEDLPESISCSSFFLASCWLGRTAIDLPDEAAGFPSWLLQAGAARVVAPLWPVSDEAALRFVESFYEHWLEDGQPAAVALASARADSHRWADHIAATDGARAAAMRSTADAFVLNGD